jgi:hypothetical protein
MVAYNGGIYENNIFLLSWISRKDVLCDRKLTFLRRSSLQRKDLCDVGARNYEQKTHSKILFVENCSFDNFLSWKNYLQGRLLADIQPLSTTCLPRNDNFRSKWMSDSTDVVPGNRSRRTQLVTS